MAVDECENFESIMRDVTVRNPAMGLAPKSELWPGPLFYWEWCFGQRDLIREKGGVARVVYEDREKMDRGAIRVVTLCCVQAAVHVSCWSLARAGSAG